MKRILAFLLITIVALSIPNKIAFQGRLTDDLGAPIEGETETIFRIYADSTGGSPLWEETQTVNFNTGLFIVNLGEVIPLEVSIFDGDMRYIEMNVDGEDISPRKPLMTVPYAFKAGEVPWDTLGAYLDTTFRASVSHIDSVAHIDSVSFIDSISFIDYITHIDSITFIDSMRFIDSVSIVEYIRNIDSITYIDSVGFISWADSAHYAGHVYWDSIRGIPSGLGEDVVNNLNSETGDITLIGGTDIDITSSSGEITIDFTGTAEDSDWNITGDDMTAIPSGNVGIGEVPPIDERLHVLGNGETTEKAIVGVSSTGSRGWLGSAIYGAYGEFDSDNFGYLGASGYGIYAEGTDHAGYFAGDVDITGDLNLAASSIINLDGASGTSGQVLARTSSGMEWTDAETAGLLWELDGDYLHPRDVDNNIRVANDSTATYAFYADLKTGSNPGYGAAFSNNTTSGSAIGILANAVSEDSSSYSNTTAGQFVTMAEDQATWGIEVLSTINNASSDKTLRGAQITSINSGSGETAGLDIDISSDNASSNALLRGINLLATNIGTGKTSGMTMSTSVTNSANDSTNTGFETYMTNSGSGPSIGTFNQLIMDNSSNMNQAYGLWSEASYSGKSHLWGIYSYTTSADTGECCAYYGQSVRDNDFGANYGGYIYASEGDIVRGWYAHGLNAGGDGVSANIGLFGWAGNNPSYTDMAIYGTCDDSYSDYAGYFAGPVLATGYDLGADIAEMYNDEGEIPDCAIVRLANPSNDPKEVSVEVCDRAYDPLLIGVRSENPAILMGRAENYEQYREEEQALQAEKEAILSKNSQAPKRPIEINPDEPGYDSFLNDMADYLEARSNYEKQLRIDRDRIDYIERRLAEITHITNPKLPGADVGSQIALAGRVRVLCTAQNGAINPGDPITSSNIPGYGKKATKTGPIVGYALGSLESGKGKVLILVSRSQWVENN